ncbi:GNAT family N-acetyltransferase [Brevundimonas sp.]|uniref:GNAT family N-acetyltransferase n=1 Tax=Brevundimonas sp. TaxID=1871086 RepID=UPI0025F60F1A|nr:GNAT family N-acetyltransferase [Brevundimonas sp.]
MSRIDGERLFLRKLTVADVSDAYVGWMNDPETNRFLETRWTAHDRAAVEAFVADKAGSATEHLYGIFLKEPERHIGNLKIGPVDARHDRAAVSYLIGARDVAGRGLATEAVRLGVRLAFERHGVGKLTAGAYADNVASIRVLEKAGFVREGVLRAHAAFESGRTDVIEFGLLPTDPIPPG